MRALVFLLLVITTIPIEGHAPRDYCRTAHGPHSSIKKCCLQHASCPIHIELGSSKYRIHNTLNYPIYYCQCELSFYKCLSRIDTGRSVSTRKAHFLETVGERSQPRQCVEVVERAVCARRFMGICIRQEKALIGSLHSISDYI